MPKRRGDDHETGAAPEAPRLARIDLHCHSRYSASSSHWLARELGMRESYAAPHLLYRLAKSRGMTHVTLTDHDTIEGALRLAHHDDFIVGEETTAFFPGESLHAHVLIWGLDEEQHREIAELRFNIVELAAYLRASGLAHGLAHPFSLVAGGLRDEHFDTLVESFGLWETRDGLASRDENDLAAELVAREARRRAGGAGAPGPTSLIGAFAGSNDHSGLDAGTTYTSIELDDETADPLGALMRGRGSARGLHGSTAKLAHTGIWLLLQGGERRAHFVRGAVRQATRSDFLWQLLERPRNRRLAARAYSILSTPGRRLRGDKRSLTSTAVREASNGVLRGDRLASGLSHDDIESLMESTWLTAMRERLGEGPSLDLAALVSDEKRLRGILDAQNLLAPYLLAAGFHARQRRHAAATRVQLAAQGLVAAPLARPLPRVAMFTDTFEEVNGVGTVLRALVDHARDNDWPFTLVSAGPARASLPCREVFPAVESYSLDVYESFPLALLPILETLRWCETEGVDVIHAATPGPVGLVAWLLANSLDVPFVATYHTDLPRLGFFLTGDHLLQEGLWAYVRLFYDQCDVVLCPSETTRRDLADHRVRSRLEPFDQAIDCGLFDPARRDDRLHDRLGGGKRVLLWVGRISPEKGLEALAAAYSDLRARRDDAQLVIVGDGPARGILEELVPDATFVGVQRDEELAAIYASADVFLFPGHAETFGQVVLEAGASGLPAVISAGTGVDDAIVRDVTAIAVAPGDHRGFAAAIERLLDDEGLRSRMGCAARAHAAARTWPATFARLAETYNDIAL